MIAIRNITASVAAMTAIVNARETERWARIASVAAAIPDDVNLTDDADVIRALYAARLCGADFFDVLDEAIERTAENRKTRISAYA